MLQEFHSNLTESFKGDYLNLHRNFDFKTLMIDHGDSRLYFSDYCIKFSRNGKAQKRILIITDRSIMLILMSGQLVEIKRHIRFRNIKSVSMSRLQGDLIAVHTGKLDTLLRVVKRVEVMNILMQGFEHVTRPRRTLTCNFGERIYLATGNVGNNLKYRSIHITLIALVALVTLP